MTKRKDPCPCGKTKSNGERRKYKNCCGINEEPKYKMKISRDMFISEPYKTCPNPECRNLKTYGVFMPIEGSKTFTRECTICGFTENFDYPTIKKKVIYLDQFVISNLIKLLDTEHPSHARVAADPFWRELFIRLERATQMQAIVCPDSFHHRDEGLVGNIDFRLMERMYEHFSSGKTLNPSFVIQQEQLLKRFSDWLADEETVFEFDAQDICEENLHSWSVGMRVSIHMGPRGNEVDDLQKSNQTTKANIAKLWSDWSDVKTFNFPEQVKKETDAYGTTIVKVARDYEEKSQQAMQRVASGGKSFDINEILPPPANDLLREMMRQASIAGVSPEQTPHKIVEFFANTDVLLEIPKMKISSVLFAGLAKLAYNGKKKPPNSFADVEFISSYLPYCDAMFVDKECFVLINELPKDIKDKYRINDYNTEVFSLNHRQAFLDYLDRLVDEIPDEQKQAVEDVSGSDKEPFWSIIAHEKAELKRKKA